MNLPIPEAALDKHIAFLGGTGSGKTSGAKSGVVERALDAGERVIVIDPTSAWWGLRLGRDGKGKGFPIYIFGGDHGDYPLRARDAEVLAEAFATSSDSAIFDTSLMTVGERVAFFTDFATAVLRKNRGPLKFIIDEAHLFMPQAGAKVGGGVPAMLHAGNNLVSLGRSRGLRITLISQRPAKLHKDSLSQVQSLVAMRLLAPQDRKAIADWIDDQADPARGKEIIASLPSLKPGEAWVWAPLANVLERVRFPMPRTFDSSRAPDIADGKGPELAPINLDALKGRLASVEAEAKANDPKLLRAEVARLKSEMQKLSGTKSDTIQQIADPRAIEAARKSAFAEGYVEGDRDGFARGAAVALDQGYAAVRDAMKAFVGVKFVPSKRIQKAPSQASIAQPVERRTSIPKVASSNLAGRSNGHDNLTSPQRKVLASVAFWKGIGHEAPSREQVAAVAGYSPSSGGFNNLIGSLKTLGYLDIPQPGRVALTSAAPYEDMTPNEAREKMRAVLSNPQLRLVDAALEGSEMSRDDLGAKTGYSPSSGGFNNLIGSLSTLGIFTKPAPGYVAVSEWARKILQ